MRAPSCNEKNIERKSIHFGKKTAFFRFIFSFTTFLDFSSFFLCFWLQSSMQSSCFHGKNYCTVNGVTIFFLDKFPSLIWFHSKSADLPHIHTASFPDKRAHKWASPPTSFLLKADVAWMDLLMIPVPYLPSLNGLLVE